MLIFICIYIHKGLVQLATSFWSATAASFSSPRPKFGSCHPPRVLPTSCARQPVFRPPLRGAPRRRRRENESRASASLSPLDRRSLGSRGAVRNKRFVLWRIYKKNKKMPLITISRGCFWERSSQASASPSPLDRRLPDSRGVVRKKKELYVRKDLQKKKKIDAIGVRTISRGYFWDSGSRASASPSPPGRRWRGWCRLKHRSKIVVNGIGR